jgi:hypothetical protein
MVHAATFGVFDQFSAAARSGLVPQAFQHLAR